MREETTWRADDAAARAAATCSRLGLAVRQGMGSRLGSRSVTGRPQASGIEVEAFQTYAPGDDLRHLDWNALGRLDALVTRRFTAEREVRFDLLLDTSASMAVPVRDRKLDAARELAMALGWMALVAGDTVRLVALGRTRPAVRTLRHRTSARRAAEWLGALDAVGPLDLGAALAAYARRHPGPAVALVLSDFQAEPATMDAGVRALRAAGHAVVLLHVIGPGELDPSREIAHGVLRDVESGATHPIAFGAALRDRYAGILAEHLAALEGLAARAGARYARLRSDERVVDVLTMRLAPLGLVCRR